MYRTNVWTPRGKVVGGGGGGGMNWEIGIDIYTLMCIKWIANKNLLFKKINKIKLNLKKKKCKIKVTSVLVSGETSLPGL